MPRSARFTWTEDAATITFDVLRISKSYTKHRWKIKINKTNLLSIAIVFSILFLGRHPFLQGKAMRYSCDGVVPKSESPPGFFWSWFGECGWSRTWKDEDFIYRNRRSPRPPQERRWPYLVRLQSQGGEGGDQRTAPKVSRRFSPKTGEDSVGYS